MVHVDAVEQANEDQAERDASGGPRKNVAGERDSLRRVELRRRNLLLTAVFDDHPVAGAIPVGSFASGDLTWARTLTGRCIGIAWHLSTIVQSELPTRSPFPTP
jgi:hypothetical protein